MSVVEDLTGPLFVTETRAAAAARHVGEWNRALLDLLFPMHQSAETVRLACDDEIVRAAGRRLGIDPGNAVEDLAFALKRTLGIDNIQGVRALMGLGFGFSRERRPRQVPSFLSALSLFVVAASRMAPTDEVSTHSYYPRLRDLLSLSPWGGEIPGFDYVPRLFALLSDWLENDEQGRRGRLYLPANCRPPWVGTCVVQTVFRERDRQVLSQFFSENPAGSLGGMDILLMLRRWSGRHRLTGHARQLVDDDSINASVRSAIETARRSWDGSVLLENGQRAWQARLRLGPRPLSLYIAAANSTPVLVKIGTFSSTLLPEREVQIPWSTIDMARSIGPVIGQTGSGDSVRLPVLGDTILFEAEERGLWRVRGAEAEQIWVLTRDLNLQTHLATWRLDRNLNLHTWLLFSDVPVTELPASLREIQSEKRMPLAVHGGLPLERDVYLVGGPPTLMAGELGTEEALTVEVNSKPLAVIRSGEALLLPGDQPGTYRTTAGRGLFRSTYHISSTGRGRDSYGEIGFTPSDERSVRSGARSTQPGTGATVCGARVLPKLDSVLPIVRMPLSDFVTLTEEGGATVHSRPPNPEWMSKAGLSSGSRWEVSAKGVAWVLCVKEREVKRWSPYEVASLDPEAAHYVNSIGEHANIRTRTGDIAAATVEWLRLVALAKRVLK